MERAARAASGLASLGVGRGDTVAVYLRNDFPFFEASFAAGLLGAYPTPVNWHYTEDEARYLFENSGARAIVIHADLLGPVRAAIPEACRCWWSRRRRRSPPPMASRRSAGAIPPGMTDWSRWLEGFGPTPAPARARRAPSSTPPAPPAGPRACAATRRRPSRWPLGAAHPGPHASASLDYLGRAREPIVTAVVGPMYHSAPNAYGLVADAAGRQGDPAAALRRRGPAAADRGETDHPPAHGADHVQPAAQAAGGGEGAATTSPRCASWSTPPRPCPPPIKRAMIEWWGPVINEYYGATETGTVVLLHLAAVAGPPRHGRQAASRRRTCG